MSEMVEIDDNGSSDVEIQEQGDDIHKHVSLEDLRTMKREVEMRQTVLGKSWQELHKMMSKYHANLVLKHEQYEAIVDDGERTYLAKLESTIEKRADEARRAEKLVTELEAKLLEKDNEIVRLRTDNHTLRNDVTMKDSLIRKLQNQMAKEAMEYSAEITSLKEILEMESSHAGGDGASARKRARNDAVTDVQSEVRPSQSERDPAADRYFHSTNLSFIFKILFSSYRHLIRMHSKFGDYDHLRTFETKCTTTRMASFGAHYHYTIM